MHVRQQMVRCGRKRCRCRSGQLHGPYWYGYYWDRGRKRAMFIGLELPEDHSSPSAIRIATRWAIPKPWTLRKALRVLAVGRLEEADAGFRRLQKTYHPDRSSSWPSGVTAEEAAAAIRAINGAREYLFERWK